MKKIILLLVLSNFALLSAQSNLATIKSFYKNNSPAKLGKDISYNLKSKVLNVDGFRFSINNVSYYYEYNDEYYSYANHFVTVECMDDSSCIKYNGKSHTSFSMPMNTKTNALKLIQMLENF